MNTEPLLTDRSTARRWMGAGSLLTAGPLILAGLLITPSPDDAVTTLREPIRTQIAADLLFLGYLLLVPGVFAMLQLVARRGAALSHVGLVLAVFGYVALPGLLSTDFYGLGIAQLAGPAQAEAVSNHLSALPGALLIVLPAKFAGPLGLILLTAGIWRSKSISWWATSAVIVGTLATVLLARGVLVVELAGTVLLSVGLTAIAITILNGRPKPSAMGDARAAATASTPVLTQV